MMDEWRTELKEVWDIWDFPCDIVRELAFSMIVYADPWDIIRVVENHTKYCPICMGFDGIGDEEFIP